MSMITFVVKLPAGENQRKGLIPILRQYLKKDDRNLEGDVVIEDARNTAVKMTPQGSDITPPDLRVENEVETVKTRTWRGAVDMMMASKIRGKEAEETEARKESDLLFVVIDATQMIYRNAERTIIATGDAGKIEKKILVT
jgi:hypothetical protein